MGTATHTISHYGDKYHGARGRVVTSGAHSTTTAASNLTDGAAGAGSAITGVKGQLLTLRGDEDMRVQFGGVAATATSGHIVFANETTGLEISGDGTISIIDVA
jgi:hypothetical protein